MTRTLRFAAVLLAAPVLSSPASVAAATALGGAIPGVVLVAAGRAGDVFGPGFARGGSGSEARITELRNFERDYRSQLRGYIEGQLRELDEKSASTDSTPVSAIGL